MTESEALNLTMEAVREIVSLANRLKPATWPHVLQAGKEARDRVAVLLGQLEGYCQTAFERLCDYELARHNNTAVEQKALAQKATVAP